MLSTNDEAAPQNAPQKPTNSGLIGTRFLDKLVAAKAGRSFLLRFLQSTEESDEGMVFNQLVARIEDPELQKMARIHRDDEVRHATIFARAVERIGVPADASQTIPRDLNIVARIDGLLGGFADKFSRREVGVMEIYALLQVIEERAAREWPAIVDALMKVDPVSARDVAGVLRDEQRHVKYAKAISRHYAPNASALERTLREVRDAEQRAFDAHAQRFMETILERQLLDVGRVERVLWKGMAFMGHVHAKRNAMAA